jgi:hypothetical protein
MRISVRGASNILVKNFKGRDLLENLSVCNLTEIRWIDLVYVRISCNAAMSITSHKSREYIDRLNTSLRNILHHAVNLSCGVCDSEKYRFVSSRD